MIKKFECYLHMLRAVYLNLFIILFTYPVFKPTPKPVANLQRFSSPPSIFAIRNEYLLDLFLGLFVVVYLVISNPCSHMK